MKKTTSHNLLKRIVALCSIFLFNFSCFSYSYASENKGDYILFISSINFNEIWTEELYWRIQKHFQQTNFFVRAESLSVPSINSMEKARMQVDRLVQKYIHLPKAIVFMGDPGFMLCRDLYDSIWKDVPTIILDSYERLPATLDLLLSKTPLTLENTVPSEEWRKGYNMAVLKQPLFIKETILLMKRLLPQMTKIAFISDDRYVSSVYRNEISRVMENDFPELTLQHLMHISTEEMLDSLISYDLRTGVIYYSWFEQQMAKDNSTYLVDHIQEVISGFTNSPLFTLADQGVSAYKFAGGHYIRIRTVEEKVIQALEQILSGVEARDISLSVEGRDSSFLNYPYLRSYNIPPSLYPEKGVTYMNPPISFYQQYKYIIFLFLISLICIILLLSFYVHTLKQKERIRENENRNLKQKEQMRVFYESVLDNLQVGVTIKNMDDGFKYTFWNKKMSELLGYEQEKVIGASYELHGNRNFVQGLQVLDQTILRERKNISVIKEIVIDEYETRFLQIVKSIIPYDETDLRIVSAITDISDIYKSKQHLEILNNKYELTLNVAGVVPWSIDLVARRIIFQGEYQSFGQFMKRVHPDDIGLVTQNYKSLIEGEKEKVYGEFRIKAQLNDPDYRWIATSGGVEKRDEEGKLTSIICASIDINTRKELEIALRQAKEEAEKANLMKSAFIASMSHEIRTPLNAIVGFSELLMVIENPEDRQHFMEIIRTNNRLLLQLINDVLDISKIESGQLELVYEDTDVNHIIDEAVNLAASQKLSGEVSLHARKPFHELFLRTDRKCVVQVLNNFITNAIKFTTQGEITAGYSMKDEQTIYFYVKDTGCGIPGEQQKRIFDRFVKLDAFTQGTGLGLSVCKEIVEQLGGTIGVTSEVGKGSEFWFTVSGK